MTLAVLASLGWQRHTTLLLRETIARQRSDRKVIEQLSAEHRRLTAAQLSPEELEKLRAERAAVSALLLEIEGMKRRAEIAARGIAIQKAAVVPMAPSLKGRPVTSDRWMNAGQSSPDAAFQTALWAAAGGDVESLAETLVFDADTKVRADKLFAQLPAAMQTEVGTSEKLVALLTAKDIASGSAQILAQYPSSTGAKIAARLFDADGNQKQMLISMKADGDSWRLIVPSNAIERYATSLQAPEPPH